MSKPRSNNKKQKGFFEKEEKTKAKESTKKIFIYWDRIYRAVSDLDKLFGNHVHMSKGELSSAEMKSDEEYKFTPLAQCDDSYALFEMAEKEEDIVSIEPKFHQPGTGVAESLSNEDVIITRIFYNPKEIKEELLAQINKLLEKERRIKIVHVSFVDLLTDDRDKVVLEKRSHIGAHPSPSKPI